MITLCLPRPEPGPSIENGPSEFAIYVRKDDGSQSTNHTGFGGCGDAGEDEAQDSKNHDGRRQDTSGQIP